LDQRTLHRIPDYAVSQIEIKHPTIDAISELGMRWYAIPCVSNMFLSIGGIDYPCAPFNGFYMGTEIASRNLADRMRYDMLPKVAVAIGHDPSSREVSLWQDRALTELNVAVLHSFSQAGVTMVDHHTESSHFEKFCRREQVAGRHVSADWAWIVPPQASSYCESYHLPMNDYSPLPNFYRNRSDDGHRLMPFYGDRHRGKWTKRLDRLRRRWKLWSRSPQ
jgi:nitric-oxide synthase